MSILFLYINHLLSYQLPLPTVFELNVMRITSIRHVPNSAVHGMMCLVTTRVMQAATRSVWKDGLAIIVTLVYAPVDFPSDLCQ